MHACVRGCVRACVRVFLGRGPWEGWFMLECCAAAGHTLERLERVGREFLCGPMDANTLFKRQVRVVVHPPGQVGPPIPPSHSRSLACPPACPFHHLDPSRPTRRTPPRAHSPHSLAHGRAGGTQPRSALALEGTWASAHVRPSARLTLRAGLPGEYPRLPRKGPRPTGVSPIPGQPTG
jgi:hypothetical protein